MCYISSLLPFCRKVLLPVTEKESVVPPWKGKGDRQKCNSYRYITRLIVSGEIFAYLLFMWISGQLLKMERSERSWFALSDSIIDRILALRVLVEHQYEFGQGMLADNIDSKKEFDLVHR